MPVIHRAEGTSQRKWRRGDKIGLASLLVAVLGIGVPVALSVGEDGPAQTVVGQNTGDTTNNFNGCFQFCEGQNPGDQADRPAAPYDSERSCTRDPNDKAVTGGWGPARNVLAEDQYSEFPAFNIDNLPSSGDERGFYDGREFGTPAPYTWHYDVDVERGKTYILRVFIHNSAAGSRDDLAAKGTRVSINLPTCTGRRIASQAIVRADNTEPQEVWGGVTFVGKEVFNLSYIVNSAVLCTNHYVCDENNDGGVLLTNDVFTNRGALIGFDSLDGEIPGGYEKSALLMFKVRPQFAGD